MVYITLADCFLLFVLLSLVCFVGAVIVALVLVDLIFFACVTLCDFSVGYTCKGQRQCDMENAVEMIKRANDCFNVFYRSGDTHVFCLKIAA